MMILGSKNIGDSDMVGDQLQEVKSEEGQSKQTEHETISSVRSHKFKPRKRKMGNLILRTNSSVGDDADNRTIGKGEEYEYSDRTFGGALSGILTKFFHVRQPSSFGDAPDEISNPEYLNTRLQEDLCEGRSIRREFSRMFETYRKRNDLKTQKKGREYQDSNFEKEKNFNRFSKLEQALDAKGEENGLRSMNNESNRASYVTKDLTLGSALEDDLQENSDVCSKTKFDTQVLLNDSPKTESAILENTVFSPNTHRPSLRDIPGIRNIEVSSPDQVSEKPHGTFRMAFKIRSNKNILYGKSPRPQDPHFSNLDDEIDSHLYYHSRRNLLSKCFPSKNLVYQDNMRETHNENTGFAPDLGSDKQISDEQPTIPTTPNSLSDSLTVIKGILQQKYKSSFSRDKNKRRNLSVRFVSPILSPIEMTNNEGNDNDHNNTKLISQNTK